MFGKQQSARGSATATSSRDLALFVALGGTAAAAITLPRDSVGVVQIRADAVRSPEIQGDAVRSSGDRSATPCAAPRSRRDAVRSSEIRATPCAAPRSPRRRTQLRDPGRRGAHLRHRGRRGPQLRHPRRDIVLRDLAPDISALDAPRVRVNTDGLQDVPLCPTSRSRLHDLALVHYRPGAGWFRRGSRSTASSSWARSARWLSTIPTRSPTSPTTSAWALRASRPCRRRSWQS